jgi:malonyl CoA-acyl carrier protein transacylase
MKVGLFPGQGIPAKTVLAGLPAGDPLVSAASEILCYDLRHRVEGVAKRQRSVLPTSLAQPAIFTASLVSWFAGRGRFDALTGHSLGEYAALVASEALSFEHGLCAVQVRGEVMNSIASRSTGGMVALLDLSIDECEEVALEAGVSVANDNCPGQMVVAGGDDALARAAELAKARGGRAVRLEVTGPFHTAAMEPATDALRDVLDHIAIRNPKVPVISNVSARPYRAPGEIRKLLVAQLTSKVRFRESLIELSEHGVDGFHDFGPGRVVAGLATRTFASLATPAAAVS